MARPVTTIVVFFLLFNLWATVLIETGAAEELGVDPSVGSQDLIDEQRNAEVPGGSGIGETLFGLYNLLARAVNGLFALATNGVAMLGNVGVPSEYLTLLRVLFGFVLAIDIISFYKGWGL